MTNEKKDDVGAAATSGVHPVSTPPVQPQSASPISPPPAPQTHSGALLSALPEQPQSAPVGAVPTASSQAAQTAAATTLAHSQVQSPAVSHAPTTPPNPQTQSHAPYTPQSPPLKQCLMKGMPPKRLGGGLGWCDFFLALGAGLLMFACSGLALYLKIGQGWSNTDAYTLNSLGLILAQTLLGPVKFAKPWLWHFMFSGLSIVFLFGAYLV